ncbi:hypothetical protein C8Q73DRAFT_397260 [Cubamyces lactineus]|nr:hypothetical protein C8Q73DRAFT_397260 [Cubamyces lactineus]
MRVYISPLKLPCRGPSFHPQQKHQPTIVINFYFSSPTNYNDTMQQDQRNEPTQTRGSDKWNDGDNFDFGGGGAQRTNIGPQGGNLPSGQMQGQQRNFGAINDPASAQPDGPEGVFASHGGQLGTDTGAQYGGDFNDRPAGDHGPTRAAAGRDDPFASSAPNFTGAPGPAIPGGGEGNSTAGTGDRFMGSIQKGAGRVMGNSNMVERGEMRKTGGPKPDDTLL